MQRWCSGGAVTTCLLQSTKCLTRYFIVIGGEVEGGGGVDGVRTKLLEEKVTGSLRLLRSAKVVTTHDMRHVLYVQHALPCTTCAMQKYSLLLTNLLTY